MHPLIPATATQLVLKAAQNRPAAVRGKHAAAGIHYGGLKEFVA